MRFINCGSAGLSDGVNVYAYVGGNPIMLVDPSGLGGQCGGGGGVVLECALQDPSYGLGLPPGSCIDCYAQVEPTDHIWRACETNNAVLQQCTSEYFERKGWDQTKLDWIRIHPAPPFVRPQPAEIFDDMLNGWEASNWCKDNVDTGCN